MIVAARMAAVGGFLLVITPAAQAQTEFAISGANAAAIQATVDSFRTALGALNPNDPGSTGIGRREITWDGVPDADAAPSRFPGELFNQPTAGLAAGVVIAIPAPGVLSAVSADALNPTATLPEFGDLNVTYPTAFEPFSSERLFAPLGTNIVDVVFRVPGSNTEAEVRGFGAVFTDVDTVGTSTIEYFHRNASLGVFDVPELAGDGSLSFLGVDFGDFVVTRVRITAGEAALGLDDVTQTPANQDVVALDDFIFGEPVPIIVDVDDVLSRLAVLTTDVDEAFLTGAKVENQLLGALGKATNKVTNSEGKKPKKAKELLKSAEKQITKFLKKLNSGGAVNNLTEAQRTAFAVEAAEILIAISTLQNPT